MSEENHNTLPEDYFLRNFPYDTLETLSTATGLASSCDEKTKDDILALLNQIKKHTPLIDTSKCYLIKYTLYALGFNRCFGHNITTSFYVRKEDWFDTNFMSNGSFKIGYNQNSLYVENNINYTALNNTEGILYKSKSLDYTNIVRPLNGWGNSNPLMRKNHKRPHHFGDNEINIDGEIYIRHTIYPYINYGAILELYVINNITIYIEYLEENIPSIDKIFWHGKQILYYPKVFLQEYNSEGINLNPILIDENKFKIERCNKPRKIGYHGDAKNIDILSSIMSISLNKIYYKEFGYLYNSNH